MPDASRARGHHDFAETMQMPPDVPCPTGPLHQFAYSDVPVPVRYGKDLHVIRNEVHVPPRHIPAPASMQFPDPEVIEQERMKRQRYERAREQITDAREAAWSELVKKAEKRGEEAGYSRGQQHGYFHGWWNGLAFGAMLGLAVCFFAVKFGWLVGHA